MKEFFDISPTVDSELAVWPGDCPYHREVSLDMAQGAHFTLSSITTTLHLGAHADAPSHYHPQGRSMEACDLRPYLGRCEVVKMNLQRGERVGVSDFRAALRGRKITSSRILFCTESSPDRKIFNQDFCSLSPELIQFLSQQGVILVGIDTPSVDPYYSKKLEAHQALFAHGLAVLEGLNLSEVPEGVYFLSALPLALVGADASPVRAVLFTEKFLKA